MAPEQTPAVRRDEPHVVASSLARFLEGPECPWAHWFQATHELRSRRPDHPDAPMWRERHGAIVDSVDAELRQEGLEAERELRMAVRIDDAVLHGRADLVATHVDEDLIDVYEMKGGRPRRSDEIQLLTYMWLMEQTIEDERDWTVAGWLVRPDGRVRISGIPGDFEESLLEAMELLTGATPPPRVPGRDCRFCPITRVDCPVRIDGD